MMLKAALLSLCTFLMALPVPEAATPCPVQEKSNWGLFPQLKSSGLPQKVQIHSDMGFYAFSFGEPNSMAYQSFHFKLSHSAFLSVVDCYNAGDTFQVFDNGVPVAVTTFPMVTYNPLAFETNAWKCMTSDDFSKASILLNPGHHNITLAVINSLQGGGAAFLRVDKACQRSNFIPTDACQDNIPGCGFAGTTLPDPNNQCVNDDCGCPDLNMAVPVPCCYLSADGTIDPDTAGRLCNQMVTFPKGHHC